MNFELKLPLFLLLVSAFSLQPSAFAQNPSVFQPVKRPSGSLNATNVFGFSQEFTNFGGTISLVHPPPPGAVGTNDFNTNQFSWTTSRKISIKSGALATNLNVFNLLLGNTNVYTDDGTQLLRNGIGTQIWTLDAGDVYTTDPTATNVFAQNFEALASARMDGRFGFGSTSANLALGTNSVSVANTANKVLLSPTNDPTQVLVVLDAPFDAQELYLKNGDTNTSWTLRDGQLNSDSGSVQLQGGDFVTGNGTNMVLHLLGEGGNWQEVGRFQPGGSEGIAIINRTDNFVPYRVDATHFGDSPIEITNSRIATVRGSVLTESVTFTNRYRLTNSSAAFNTIDLISPGTGGTFRIGGSGGTLALGGGLSSSLAAISNLTLIHNGYSWIFTDDGFSPTLRPTASNTHHLGSLSFPIADLFLGTNSFYLGTNKYADNGTDFLRNGVPIGTGPWTDDGTNTALDGNVASFNDSNGNLTLGTVPGAFFGQSATSLSSMKDLAVDGVVYNQIEVSSQNDGTNVATARLYASTFDTYSSLVLDAYPGDGSVYSTVYVTADTNGNVIRFDANGTDSMLLTNGSGYFTGNLMLSGQTNLIGMSAGGQLTVDGVPVGGGSGILVTDGVGTNTTFYSEELTNVLVVAGLTTESELNASDYLFSTDPPGPGWVKQSGDTDYIKFDTDHWGLFNQANVSLFTNNAANPWEGSWVADGGLGDPPTVTKSVSNGATVSGNLAVTGGIAVRTLLLIPSVGSIDASQNELNNLRRVATQNVDEGNYTDLGSFNGGSQLQMVTSNVTYFVSQLRPGTLGGQISISDTNGLANFINIYASTNSGSAVLYTEGSPPTATVPIDETSGAYVFPNTVTTNLVIPLVATIRITNGLVMAVTGP